MKKFLLSLLCLAGFTAAQADEVAFVADGATYSGTAATVTIANNSDGNIVGKTFANDYISITHTQKSSSNSNVTSSVVRWYQSDLLTLTPSSGTTITKVEAVIASGSKGAFTAEIGTVTGTGTSVGSSVTWEGETTDPLVLTAAKQVRFTYMVVTYTVGEVTKVSQPVISPAGGEITTETEISITCDTEEASIYYTTDGNDPTTESTLYEGPFTLSTDATVKAIAVKTGLTNSSIASVTFNLPINVANIAEFIETASSNAATITGTVTVVAQYNSYLFVQDESGKIIVYGSLGQTYNNGDQLTGIKGTWSPYNGLPEMKPETSSFGAATTGTAVEPETLAIEEIAIDNLLAYIKIEGVTIPESTSKSFTISDETGSITMYNTLGITVPSGENLTVTGFISCYNTTVQVMPLEITSASGMEVVEMPEITPNGGTISKDQTIEITCATDGASIYYTTNGNDPTTESTLYEGPFTLTEECTVKAIAVADNMENSAIAEAVFTFLSEDSKTATYDFTDPSSLTPAQPENAFGGGNDSAVVLNDVELSAGDTKLVCAKGTATTDSRIWAGTSAYDLRTYNGSTITISVANGTLTSIVFEGNKIDDTYATASNGTFANKTWTASENVSEVMFSVSKTTNINTITVTYQSDSSAIENVEAESDEAVEYYNLQGVKVANPENGLYIMKQGNKATKVLVK